jgi:hypothetical protein
MGFGSISKRFLGGRIYRIGQKRDIFHFTNEKANDWQGEYTTVVNITDVINGHDQFKKSQVGQMLCATWLGVTSTSPTSL